MKKALRALAVLGVLELSPGSSTDAGTPKSSKTNDRRTASVASFAKIRLYARTMTGEDPAFRIAIDSLDAKAAKSCGV